MNNSTQKFVKVRFATFNIGDFSGRGFTAGSEEAKKIIRQTMASVNADLWALQEDTVSFGNGDPYTAIYDTYRNYERRGCLPYNIKAFLSDHEICDVKQMEYTGDSLFRHPWFLCGYITLNGRKICLISLHFDWSDKNVRAKQISQVLSFAAAQEYCVIMGDFNPEDYENDGQKISDTLLYREEFALFADAGFTLANGGVFGLFDTILDTDISPCPFDNIIVSEGITIENAGRIADPWMTDHAIVWADLLIP